MRGASKRRVSPEVKASSAVRRSTDVSRSDASRSPCTSTTSQQLMDIGRPGAEIGLANLPRFDFEDEPQAFLEEVGAM
jgi:hypothetical protein